LHVPVVTGVTADEVLPWLSSHGFVLRGAVSQGGSPHTDVDWSRRSALVLGNEATGLDDSIRPRLDELVTVTMSGNAESLNVAIAGAVIFFEAFRQRSTLSRVGAQSRDYQSDDHLTHDHVPESPVQ
jgi:TrmH family RNA methyltransferase